MTSTSTSHGGRAAAAVAVALTLVACGTEVAGSSGGSGSLPVLRIGTGQYGAIDAVAPRGSGSGASSGATSPDPYPLRGTLPGGPPTAAVYRFGTTAVTRSDAAALASALGVTGTPVRHPHGWEIATTAGEVRVRDGGSAWSFSRGASGCPSYVVDIDNADGATSANGCAVAPTMTVPPGASAPPSDTTALSAARPALRAAGLDPASARVLPASAGYPLRTVVLDPVVAGLATSGVRTVVDVDRAGVLGATGVLATPTAGESYPIVSAAAALDRLRAMPRPEIAIACVQGAVCPGVGPRPVTGATLGLSQAYDAGTAILVPAWLFTVTGSPDPIAVVAVERRYLGDPSPGPIGSAPGASSAPDPGASGAGSGSVPGSSGGPATPVPVSEPPSPILPVLSVTLGSDASTLVLRGVGGVCDDYSGAAAETSSTITLSIVATPQSPVRVCAAMARELTVTVALAAPWSNRTLVDAATGKTLRLS